MNEEKKQEMSVFTDTNRFELAQRAAKLLSSSKLVPPNFQNNIPDCLMAQEIANRIGTSTFVVMQNLYPVHGKWGWSSTFLISAINTCGKFSSLQYDISGKDDDLGCVAFAYNQKGDRVDSPRVTIGMAKAEGWMSKPGSKWKTMPQLMLCYRAAAFFARLYVPEITMGFKCVEELIDITPVKEETKSVFEERPIEIDNKSIPKKVFETRSEVKTELL